MRLVHVCERRLRSRRMGVQRVQRVQRVVVRRSKRRGLLRMERSRRRRRNLVAIKHCFTKLLRVNSIGIFDHFAVVFLHQCFPMHFTTTTVCTVVLLFSTEYGMSTLPPCQVLSLGSQPLLYLLRFACSNPFTSIYILRTGGILSSQPLQHLQTATACCNTANHFMPWAGGVLSPQPLQCCQLITLCCR
jgi:hypothetical protein